jgi:murein L,D-transpeptidase YcbB/YkuD
MGRILQWLPGWLFSAWAATGGRICVLSVFFQAILIATGEIVKAFRHRLAALPFLVLGATVAMGASSASAQNLFERLFGGHRYERYDDRPDYGRYRYRGGYEQQDERLAPATQPQTPRKPVRISGPTYRPYKPDPLVRVDFTPVIQAPHETTFQPSLQASGFEEARATLADVALYATKDVAKALNDYYAKHPDFIWVSGFGPNSRAEQALRVLADAASYGLNPADYAVTVPSAAFSFGDTAGRLRELTRFEVELSAKVLRYVHDAYDGRVAPDRMSEYYDLPVKPLDMVAVLTDLSQTFEVSEYLEAKHPQAPQYQELRAELATLRDSPENDIVVRPDLLLKPGGTDPDFPKILQLISQKADDAFKTEYGALLDANTANETYSQDLVPLVKAAQKANGLSADGVIGPRTVKVLAGETKAAKIAKVTLALEEMRWLPHTLGDQYVFINEPAYRVTFTKGGQQLLSMRAVVGRPTNQTTFFYDQIEEVVFNPYWGVPQSIIVNEMLPRLVNDPGYLDRAGYEVTDMKGNRIPSAAIDWGRYGTHIPYNVRQVPSDDNALGELKILFPNKHAIYMHDTPAKSLFKRDMRAFSHGCVRLQEPRQMAAAVLGTSVDAIAAKLKQGHTSEKVPVKIPVYVAYFTAWPDAEGKMQYYDDVYGRDARLTEAMQKTDAARAPVSEEVSGAIEKADTSADSKL